MSSLERAEVLQQKLEHWCAASLRALANEPQLQYRGHNLYRRNQYFPVQAPYLQLDFTTHDTSELRGVADAIALRIIHSNTDLHTKHQPELTLQKLIFELLEQLRCEALVPQELNGMAGNLHKRFLFWAKTAATSKLIENDIGLLVFTLLLMAWSRLHIQPIPEQIEDVVESTRWGLAKDVGQHLRELRHVLNDQTAFADIALIIAKRISVMAGELIAIDGQEGDVENTLEQLIDSKSLNLKWLESESDLVQHHFGVSQADVVGHMPNDFEYRVFTRIYDKEVNITTLVRAAQLQKFRTQLDKRVRQQTVNTHRVARYLSQLVASPKLSGWSFGEEQGYLDSARLSRLVTSPDERKLFRRENTQRRSNCIVSLLIDNSGSMNHHNETVAALVDTLAKALELAGINTEILGFTTGEWNGGQAMQDWSNSGKPAKPGRVNSLQHTIYKESETPWRRSRPAIAGMLRTDLFRESFDGEALEWAASRLEQRREQRKIILVISDGSPMDTATAKLNSERYLDHHLVQVAHKIEQRPDLQLCAIGVGLDLSAYYQESLAITLSNELITKDYFEIAELLHRAI